MDNDQNNQETPVQTPSDVAPLNTPPLYPEPDQISESANLQNPQETSETPNSPTLSTAPTPTTPSYEQPQPAIVPNPETEQKSPQNSDEPLKPPVASVITTPNQPKNNNSNILLKIGLVILLIAIIVGGVYLFMQNGQSEAKSQKNSLIQESNQTTTNTPSPIPNPTANWNSYATKYYTVQYPKDSTLNEEDEMLSISKWGPTQKAGTELFDGYVINFNIVQASGKTPEIYAEEQIKEIDEIGNNEVVIVPKPTTLNGYSGVTYTEEGLGSFTKIILESDNSSVLSVISTLVADPGNLGFQETANQILSTFKFIEGM